MYLDIWLCEKKTFDFRDTNFCIQDYYGSELKYEFLKWCYDDDDGERGEGNCIFLRNQSPFMYLDNYYQENEIDWQIWPSL